MTAWTRRKAVIAIIIPWDDGLGVSYTYPDGSAEAGPIGPEDWPIIQALEREGKVSFSSKSIQGRFSRMRQRKNRDIEGLIYLLRRVGAIASGDKDMN